MGHANQSNAAAFCSLSGILFTSFLHSGIFCVKLALAARTSAEGQHRPDVFATIESVDIDTTLSAMSVSQEFTTRNPLDFALKMACSDLNCYGESFQPEGGLLAFRHAYTPESIALSEEMKAFSATASSEKYAADVGIVGTASTATSYLIRELETLLDDQYFFSAGGPRLAVSAGLYHTAVTITLRKIPWSADLEGLPWHNVKIGSLLPYRQAPLVGIVVLYLVKQPKLVMELQRYLCTVMRCASPLIELSAERALYERRVRRGGNKYRRLRRALLSTIRAKKMSKAANGTLASLAVPAVGVTAKGVDGLRSAAPVDIEAGKATDSSQDGTPEGDGKPGSYQPLELETADVTSSGGETSAAGAGEGKRTTQWEQLVAAQLTLAVAYLHKWLGGKPNMPVRVDPRLSLVAFVGCFVTIACWQVMSDGISQIFVYHGVVNPMSLPGSFGALCTIIFALPAVPLAQPRIVLLAHTWAMAVSTALLYIFDQYHYVWLQKALAVAITVSGMAKFGILNPPAGAVSLAMLTYANSSAYSIHGWLFLIVSTYLGCCTCIAVGVVWHNMFTGRTYPLFW